LANFGADSQGPLYLKKDGSDKGVLSPNASSYAPSIHTSSKAHEKVGSHGDLIEGSASGKVNGETKSVNSRGTPYGSDSVGGTAASSGPGLSPSSSVGSLSSEKSTLNPNAKVWKFKLDFLTKDFFFPLSGSSLLYYRHMSEFYPFML